VDNTNIYLSFASSAGMILVGVLAVGYWRWKTSLSYRWFWIGATLWVVGVAIKVGLYFAVDQFVFGVIKAALPQAIAAAIGGLYGGFTSCLCEIGLTWAAVWKWPAMGQNADRAIGVGIGAGAFEAILLGIGATIGTWAALAGGEGTEALRTSFESAAKITPLFWLVATAERIIAILCHASSRALVILGSVHRRPGMILSGFAIFTFIDAVATGVHVSGQLGKFSVWWIELALLPAAVVSVPILRWCYEQWGAFREANLGAAPAV
jgi:hypothetical protein